MNQGLIFTFMLMQQGSSRITGCENPEGKVLFRDFNRNLNKLIQDTGEHLGNNVFSDENRWKGYYSYSI